MTRLPKQDGKVFRDRWVNTPMQEQIPAILDVLRSHIEEIDDLRRRVVALEKKNGK